MKFTARGTGRRLRDLVSALDHLQRVACWQQREVGARDVRSDLKRMLLLSYHKIVITTIYYYYH